MGKNPQRQKTGSGPVLKTPVAREFSSGGVVFKKVKGKGQEVKVLWLISKSQISELYPHAWWRLQKGWIDESDKWGEPGPISRGEIKATEEDLQATALREVEEEGGVEARIIQKIGTEKFFFNSKMRKGNVLKFVTFYLMEWVEDSVKGLGFETSEISWLPYEDAYKKLTHGGEKQILKKANDLLASLLI